LRMDLVILDELGYLPFSQAPRVTIVVASIEPRTRGRR